VSPRIVTATADLRTFAGAAPESDLLLSFCRDIFINRIFAPLAGQPDLRVGELQGSDSVSIRHSPLKPLPDPIPLKIQFPVSGVLYTRSRQGRQVIVSRVQPPAARQALLRADRKTLSRLDYSPCSEETS